MDRLPYIYKLTDTLTGMWYIGSRVAKGCAPEDLGVTYFTSSKVVEPLFRNEPARFHKEIMVVSEDYKYIIRTEKSMLIFRNAKEDPNSYNMHNGDGEPDTTKIDIRKTEGARKVGRANVEFKRGWFAEGMQSIAGKKGCEHNRRMKKGIFAEGHNSKAGKERAKQAKEKGELVFNHEEAVKRGKHAASIVNVMKRKCNICGKVCPPGPMKNHQSFTGHTGFTDI